MPERDELDPASAVSDGWPDGYADTADDRRALFVLSALAGTPPSKMIELAHRTGSASASLRAIRSGASGTPGIARRPGTSIRGRSPPPPRRAERGSSRGATSSTPRS